GGASLHNCMSGHGPDAETWEKATNAELKPHYIADTLAFMFETQLPLRPTKYAMESKILQHEYFECWQGRKKHFQARLDGSRTAGEADRLRRAISTGGAGHGDGAPQLCGVSGGRVWVDAGAVRGAASESRGSRPIVADGGIGHRAAADRESRGHHLLRSSV